ncbi:ENTH/VHS [Parasponia andersonii]|uniref:ENTH/VHS n=1 Tax=Parasponia andersonii TaxID=3476 RepID=A0A2P5AIV2_PARAD|nr:ENTH/VHS [Parasponia andersonii]
MEEEREGVGGGGKVRSLICKATNSTEPEVDPRLLKAIKLVVRYSDSELRLAAHTLMDLMKCDHAQVRYLTLLIIDQLFMRSKLFRNLLVENMDNLLTLSVGFRRTQPLPAPPAIASLLRSKAIEFLEKWNESFGIHYRQLRLGFDYLKNTLRFQFPNLQENVARRQQERSERERRSKEILVNKFETLKENFSSMKDEIQTTIKEIGECLGIVRSGDEPMVLESLDEEDFVEFHSIELRQLRLSTLEEGEKVHENTENKVVFDALRELYKLVMTKHLVSVGEWISVLVRVEVTDNKLRDSILKELIDIRNRLQSVKKKCEEAGCSLSNTGNDNKEEDFWEEGKIECTESGGSLAHQKGNKGFAVASTSSKVKNSGPSCSRKDHGDKKMLGESRRNQSDCLKSKLLADAPVVKWGSYLDNWGSKRDVLANQRGLELEGHWGRVDYDAVIPAEKIAELNIQATVYKEDQVEIQPCGAPLNKGGLCQRRDLRVCPFHGPIVPRDNEGKPLDRDSSKNETTSDSGTDIVERLARQAVKNVRERDKEAERRRVMDKRSLKRAKHAKIKEHNEGCLKDAALTSTSRSAAIGEDMEATNAGNPFARKKKQTLASMLRTKVTPKDRLAQRLLNTRASDATLVQLTLGEDANYREAFPNQW